MVKAFSAYLNFCYIARQGSFTTTDLDVMDVALEHFHQH
jgi:hypothetical protein